MEQNFFHPQSEEPPLEGEGDSSLQDEARRLINPPPLIQGHRCCQQEPCQRTHRACYENCEVCKRSIQEQEAAECLTKS